MEPENSLVGLAWRFRRDVNTEDILRALRCVHTGVAPAK